VADAANDSYTNSEHVISPNEYATDGTILSYDDIDVVRQTVNCDVI
jgi:hypothetical protein